MGLGSEERTHLRVTYAKAFSFACTIEPSVAIVDFMQFVKVIDTNALVLGDLIKYFVGKIKELALKSPNLKEVIVIVDKAPHPVKRMVEHKKRYEKANVLEAISGKAYLPAKLTDMLPGKPNADKREKQAEWLRFAGNYKLMQRELYPRLYNAFMFDEENFLPRFGQKVILCGFPGYSLFVDHVEPGAWFAKEDPHGRGYYIPAAWQPNSLPITEEMEQEDAELYNRVYIIEHGFPSDGFPNGPVLRYEWEEAKNAISEADIAVFWFLHYYQAHNVAIHINDGDAFSIGLLQGQERVLGQHANGKFEFRNTVMLCMPYKVEDKEGFFANKPKYEWCDLNILYELVMNNPDFVGAGVQNPVATQVFMLIMSETDFFKNFLKGVGTPTIWKTFLEDLPTYSHMVMLSHTVPPNTRTPREIVIDEELFIKFCALCIMAKHEQPLLKKSKSGGGDGVAFNTLVAKVNASKNAAKDDEYKFPSRNKRRVWCRKIKFNMSYWKNDVQNFPEDPFKQWHGENYYPFACAPAEGGGPKEIDYVSTKPEPVEEVWEQHMYGRRKRQRELKNDSH